MSHRLEIHFRLTFPCDWAVPLKDGSDSQCIWTEVKWQEMLDPLESLFPFLVFDRRLNFPHERKFLGKKPSLYIALFFQKCIHHFFKITFFWLFLCVFQIKRGEVVSNTQLHQQFCMALKYTMQECRTSDVLTPIYTSRARGKNPEPDPSLKAGNLPSLA